MGAQCPYGALHPSKYGMAYRSVGMAENLEMTSQIDDARRAVLLKAIETIGAIEGLENDAAFIRCAQRMIAEVLGLPLGPFRLLMERGPQKPLYLRTPDSEDTT